MRRTTTTFAALAVALAACAVPPSSALGERWHDDYQLATAALDARDDLCATVRTNGLAVAVDELLANFAVRVDRDAATQAVADHCGVPR